MTSAASTLAAAIAALGCDVRYVALYSAGHEPQLWSRADLANASSSDSDRYEELLVNPTLLTLTRQRGNIDCGGLRYVVVRYGNFFQVVAPTGAGHISVALEPDTDVAARAEAILRAIATHES